MTILNQEPNINRESWLTNAVNLLRKLFMDVGLELPPNIVVSCGWPSKSVGKRIGECWSHDLSDGGVFEIFISPRISGVTGPDGILSILVHELLHVYVGTEHGHKAPFKKAMKKIGLEGKATATNANEALVDKINTISAALGEYPHKRLNLKSKAPKDKVKTLTKLVCPKDDCDYIIMVKTRLIQEKGVPNCPVHGVPFEEDGL